MKNVLFSAIISAFTLIACSNPSDKPTVAAAPAATPVETAKPIETAPAAAAAAAAPAPAAASQAPDCLAPGALYGMKIGMSIADAKKQYPLTKAKENRAEGTFDVYQSAQEESANGDMTIYVEKKGGQEVVKSMEFTGDCKNKEGIKVGSTLADLRKAYPKLVAHGSEMESRVTVEAGGYSFLLNASSNKYNLDQATLKATVKVKAVIF